MHPKTELNALREVNVYGRSYLAEVGQLRGLVKQAKFDGEDVWVLTLEGRDRMRELFRREAD